jgi:hypothetical protein
VVEEYKPGWMDGENGDGEGRSIYSDGPNILSNFKVVKLAEGVAVQEHIYSFEGLNIVGSFSLFRRGRGMSVHIGDTKSHRD